MITKEKFAGLIIALAIYNVAYGGFCYYIAGIPGVLLGMNIMLFSGLIGVLISQNRRNRKSKWNLKLL